MSSEPKELKIKLVSKEEAAWTSIKNKAKEELEIGKRELIINKSIIELAEKRIEIAKMEFSK